MPKLDSEQQKIIRTINREARYLPKGLRRKFKLAAIETGLVESGLHNLNGGDADSAGWRQERASLYKDPTNVAASVKRFREEFLQHYNPGERAGDVAAQVQRPASQYRGRYQAAKPQALEILQQYGGGAPAAGAPGYQTSVSTTPGVDNSALRQQAKLSYLDQRGNPDALLELAQTLRDAQDIPGTTTTRTRRVPGQPAPGRRGAPLGEVSISPNADRPDARTHKSVVRFVRQVAGLYGQPLEIGTGTNHNQMTVSGNVSDHWTGNAADIPLAGRALVKAGQDALIAAGMPRKQARKQRGGLFNVTRNGVRYQIIFNTHEGGDHTNHLHVGLRKD